MQNRPSQQTHYALGNINPPSLPLPKFHFRLLTPLKQLLTRTFFVRLQWCSYEESTIQQHHGTSLWLDQTVREGGSGGTVVVVMMVMVVMVVVVMQSHKPHPQLHSTESPARRERVWCICHTRLAQFQDSVVTDEKFVRLNMVGVVRKNVSVSYSALRLGYESLKEEQELAITFGYRAKSRDLPYPVQGQKDIVAANKRSYS